MIKKISIPFQKCTQDTNKLPNNSQIWKKSSINMMIHWQNCNLMTTKMLSDTDSEAVSFIFQVIFILFKPNKQKNSLKKTKIKLKKTWKQKKTKVMITKREWKRWRQLFTVNLVTQLTLKIDLNHLYYSLFFNFNQRNKCILIKILKIIKWDL